MADFKMPTDEQAKARVHLEHIDSFGKSLSEWEVGFVADLLDNWKDNFTQKQIETIYKIYERRC